MAALSTRHYVVLSVTPPGRIKMDGENSLNYGNKRFTAAQGIKLSIISALKSQYTQQISNSIRDNYLTFNNDSNSTFYHNRHQQL